MITDSVNTENTLNEIVNLCYKNPFDCKQRIDSIYNISTAEKNQYFISKTLNVLGIYYDIINQWDSALYIYEKALKIAEKNGYKKLQASIWNNIGLIHWNKLKNDSAISYYFKALELYESISDSKGTANVYSNISLILFTQRNYEKAIYYQHLALQEYVKSQADRNIAISYTNLGIYHEKLSNLDSSLYYLRLAAHIKQKIEDLYGLAITYNDLGALFLKTDNHDSALHYFDLSLRLSENFSNKKLIVSNLASIGKIYLQIKKFQKAENILKSAEKIAQEQQLLYPLLMVYDRLSKVYENTGNFKQSMMYYKNAYNLYAEINQKQRDSIVLALENRYQFQKKLRELAEKEKLIIEKTASARINFLISVLALLLLIISIIAMFAYARKQRQKKENEARRMIENLKKEISKELHDNIGSNLTFVIATLEYTLYKQPIFELAELLTFTRRTLYELRQMVRNLNIADYTVQHLKHDLTELVEFYNRHDSKTKISLNFKWINDASNPILSFNILRIVKEGLNNVIKHAHASEARIEIEGEKNHFRLMIIDNGVGFNPEESKNGNGLKNIKQRVDMMGGTFSVISNENIGTKLVVIV
ncbi:MAG: tetratricopeptide repeat protein [Thermaurantimonas sp.]|uniref:tetratricopeptide repeat-containing sensor histidine kinase n=1 Tax=Thermaurantimonas sp. TaxID=2681568 RepID=UPI00391CED88